MNNIANLSTIFMNFQGAINGLRADFETVKTELNRVNQELASLKEKKPEESPAPSQTVDIQEALDKVKSHVNELLELQATHFTKTVDELAEKNKKVIASVSDINNAVTTVVATVSDLNKEVTSTSTSLNNLSGRVTAAENKHTITIDDVKGLIDASLAMLIANLSGPIPNEITTAPEVSAPLAPIPETETDVQEKHELEQPVEEASSEAHETGEKLETHESTIPTTEPVEAEQASAPVKRGGRGRGRGKKSA